MAFKYRLQKFLEIRIKKKEEQLLVVQRAQAEVIRIQGLIDANNREIADTRQNMRQCSHLLIDAYDKFLKHLYDNGEKLEELKAEAIEVLKHETQELMEREKEVNVLEKHRENAKEAYLKEEKALELKQLSEVAVQRHFAKTRDAAEEELMEELKELEGKG